jgi:DNA-binding NarL/FixJ family response regulator
VRIVIGEDTALFRQGLARLLTDAGIDVVGEAGDALLALVAEHDPDVAISTSACRRPTRMKG